MVFLLYLAAEIKKGQNAFFAGKLSAAFCGKFQKEISYLICNLAIIVMLNELRKCFKKSCPRPLCRKIRALTDDAANLCLLRVLLLRDILICSV